MPCGYKKVKRRKKQDFNENEYRYNPENKHYRGTSQRKFENLAREIVDERQDGNRRRFIRAKKRLMFNKMAAIRSRKNDFRTDV